ncbi:sulfotransferase-like domain-containing protein [Mangrovicoccus algicola]|uniref:HAD family hydrolase n=1 Tax=Mangrovicoccus algicola TaxID=2771008 RepID=A0A8J6YSM7_9RHOB|nr:HAD family hydrolase [Mangrovicoccus algicola]MBE3636820.1 HAD family hydrolase [Mangrovicoccus algicola]
MSAPLNIAAWSGPRNLSTAMMYAFGARTDAAVWDEPFYAAYLEATGLDHPMREEIIAAGPRDAGEVAARCAAPHPSGRPVFYQKHMTHHMVPAMPRGWFGAVTHLFLIRHPARVLASYAQKRENPDLADIGFAQQAEIFAAIRAGGQDPVVVDSHDIRDDPAGMMDALCDRLGIARDPGMIRWPAGGHADDGVWASHWYDAVHGSTGFAGAEGPLPGLPADLQSVCDAALPHYEALKPFALKA